MDILYAHFPVSGVDTWVFIPPLVAFVVSTFTSMGGVSGAFLLLPFQVSVLNFTTPSVSATNFVYNIVAIPSGVYRYLKEGRMAWPLTWIVIVGTLPGVLIGYYLRVMYLPKRSARAASGFKSPVATPEVAPKLSRCGCLRWNNSTIRSRPRRRRMTTRTLQTA